MESRLLARIEWMANKGSSLIMNYSYDDAVWEVDWIVRDTRHRGVALALDTALAQALDAAGALWDCDTSIRHGYDHRNVMI